VKTAKEGQIINTKKSYRKSDTAAMCKFTLDDLTGNVEVICFTKSYAQYKEAIGEGEIVKIRGRVIKTIQDPEPCCKLTIRKLKR